MPLPFEPPVEPMLAKLQREIPTGDGWLYEPKWDGFRAIIFRDRGQTTIISRDERPFDRYFPELHPALDTLAKTCVVDGEIVIPGKAALEFDSLLLRIHPAASRVRLLADQTPASFVAFDLLASGSTDLREKPFADRRKRLEKLVPDRLPSKASKRQVMSILRPAPRVVLTSQTEDPKTAKRWFEAYEGAGLDGVVAKPNDLRYVHGKREMIKVKHQRTVDCVVGGYRLSKAGDGIGSLLLGLYDDQGNFHYVGHTSSFKAAERRELLKRLKKLEGGRSFAGGRMPGGPSRWTGGKDTSWVPLEPTLVCEVAYDHMQGYRFRHAATFLRWRPEKPPKDCKLDQVLPV